jgi:hypothetical protein
MNAFDILMVIAVGAMTGTGIGLVIGCVAKKQGSAGSKMTRDEKILNFALITVCSGICSAGLALTFLV